MVKLFPSDSVWPCSYPNRHDLPEATPSHMHGYCLQLTQAAVEAVVGLVGIGAHVHRMRAQPGYKL